MEINQPKRVKPKMRGRKIGNVVIWQGELRQKSVQQTGIKQGLGVLRFAFPDRACIHRRGGYNRENPGLIGTQSQENNKAVRTVHTSILTYLLHGAVSFLRS